jgi:hypothetical protein
MPTGSFLSASVLLPQCTDLVSVATIQGLGSANIFRFCILSSLFLLLRRQILFPFPQCKAQVLKYPGSFSHPSRFNLLSLSSFCTKSKSLFRNSQVHVPQYSGPCSAIFRSMFRNIQVHVPQYSGPSSAIFKSMFRNIHVNVPQYSGSSSAIIRSMFRNIQVQVLNLICVSTTSKSAPRGEAFDFII